MSTEPSPVMTITNVIENITQPQALQSFYDKKVTVFLHRTEKDAGTDIQLPPVFPFMRLYDLKLAIYKHLKDSPLTKGLKLYPGYQFLSFSRVAGTRSAVDFQWFIPGKKSPILLAKPFDLKKTKQIAVDFVDENGAARNLTLTDTSKLLVQNLKNTELHLYFYDDMKEAGAENEAKWNAYLRPYFPELSYGKDTLDKKKIEARYARFLNMMVLAENLNGLLDTMEFNIQFTGVRRLQLRWENTDKVDVETLFYSAPVTENRPYMRLMPNKGTSITKLHLQEDNIPDPDLARVLKQWTRERNPNPESDYVMAKCVVKKGEAQQFPIYMTLRFTYSKDGEYADATILPPKGVRKLDTLFTETEDDGRTKKIITNFQKGVDKLPYAKLPIHLQNATLIYGVQLPPKPVFTKGTLKLRLAKFLPFFQEIPPLPGDQTIATLRYKCVDNFTNETRISSFLTQYANLKMIKGETDTAILSVLEEEFQLDTEAAQDILVRWLKGRGDFDLIDTHETVEASNTGIDIAIFAQHPFFSFHLHNVMSEVALQQVLTLLSILFTASDESLRLSPRVVEKIKVAEAAVVAIDQAEAAEDAEDDGSGLPPGDDDLWKQFAAVDAEPLEQEVRNEYVSPEDELGDAIEAPTEAPVEAPAEEEATEATAPAVVQDGKISADFFLVKLKEADKNLFDYTKTHPSLKKYVSMCAANVTRQPAVISRVQFEEMRDVIYEADLNAENPRIAFVEYPLQKGQKIPIEANYDEIFFFMRYGTTPQKKADNYYICSKYFCGRDELIILEKDFKGTTLRRPVVGEDRRERTTKAPNTCPFCEGKPVINRRNPGINETVLIRQDAPKTQGGIYHKYVGFLKKTPHPEGFHLPCCFIDNSIVYESDKYYDKFRDIRQIPAAAAEEEQRPPEMRKRDEPMFPKEPYIAYMARAFTKYIVGSEKLPLEIDELEGPQIGLLPPLLDTYFRQDISNFINPKTRNKLKPDAEGFLRIGVENRARFKSDSFLAAIAPFYMQRSAREMKAIIKQSLQSQPSVFFQLNYGNFLLEHYDIQMKAPSQALLQRWLEGTDINNWGSVFQLPGSLKRSVVERFYISYNSFLGWLDTDAGYTKGWIEEEDTMKEYRQLASLLAQPDFVLRLPNMDDKDEEAQRPGITFIVLDITADNKLEVRCPPYGFNQGVHGNNDIAFLLHHHSGIWEPIFHVNKGRYSAFFQRGWKQDAEEIGWPIIVKERKMEYEASCTVDPRLSYSSRQLEKKTLVPASVLYNKLINAGVEFDGILRDPYNHLVALVFKNLGSCVPIPCVDDGHIFPATKVYLDWDDVYTSSTREILEFYKTHITFRSSRGDMLYEPIQVWYETEGDKAKIFAILLKNNSILPVKTKKLPVTLVSDGDKKYYEKDEYKIMAVEKRKQEMEWEINKQVLGLSTYTPVKEEEEKQRESTLMSPNDISDIFEHLRITFAKWLSNRANSGEVRKKLKEIIYGEESLSDKRKELYTYLNSKIFSWFSDASSQGRHSIQRVDCTSITDKDACSGRCVWSLSNQCLIHTPKDKLSVEISRDKGKIEVDIQYLLFFKLIEELLRFAEKRRELFEDDVSQIGIIDRRIQDGDQEFLPENTPAWYERLRGDWVQSTEEKPKFFEEMSIPPVDTLAPIDDDTKLPPALETFLDKDDVLTKSLRILRGTPAELLSIIGYTGAVDLPLSSDQLGEIMKQSKMSIAQIDIRADPPTAIFKKFKFKVFTSTYFILVLTEEGPALLVRDPATKELPITTQLPLQLQKYFEVKRGGRLTRRKSRIVTSHR
jgi:hypothetical protein